MVDIDMLSDSDFLMYWLRKIRDDDGLMLEQVNDDHTKWYDWLVRLDIDVISGEDLAKIVLICDSLNLKFIIYNKDNYMNLYFHLNRRQS